jgi:outer membrane protein OmpA-like peptidoglycan-associated protein
MTLHKAHLMQHPTQSPSGRVPFRRTRILSLPRLAALAAVAALAPLAAGACASKPKPVVDAPPPVEVNVPSPPVRPMPTPNRQLLDEVKKAGLEAREVDEGIIIYLPTVFLFEFDRAVVAEEARKQLREVGRLLTTEVATDRRVTVEGHADAVGSRAYNRALSGRRATAVVQELVAAGVRADRISTRVFGEDKPLEPNRRPDGTDNPEGRAKNRRVALLIENPNPAQTKKPTT